MPAKVGWSDLRRVYKTVLTIEQRTFKLRLFKRLRHVKTYRVAVGQPAYPTPSGTFAVTSKQVNPVWTAPNSPWAGELAGTSVAGGAANNPLKARWMGLAGGVGIHGTGEPWSIGTRASHGCIRMTVPGRRRAVPPRPAGRAGLHPLTPAAQAREPWATMSAVPPSTAVLVTGCSSGIGAATAARLATAGWTVYATARRPETLGALAAKGCRTLALDVTDEASMRAAVAAVEEAEGAVGVLVNNAGYSQSGAVESVTMDAARRQFETNVLGLLRMCQLVLPGMRAQRWGRIVNVSSMGGRLTFPGGGPLPREQARGRGAVGRAALRGPPASASTSWWCSRASSGPASATR